MLVVPCGMCRSAVTAARSPRRSQALRSFDPTPIHDRWIDAPSEPRVPALVDLTTQLEKS